MLQHGKEGNTNAIKRRPWISIFLLARSHALSLSHSCLPVHTRSLSGGSHSTVPGWPGTQVPPACGLKPPKSQNYRCEPPWLSLVYFFFFFFGNKDPCISGWFQTFCIAENDLVFVILLAPPPLLRLQVCSTTPAYVLGGNRVQTNTT